MEKKNLIIRKLKRVEVQFWDWRSDIYAVEIPHVIGILKDMQAVGATHIKLHGYSDDDGEIEDVQIRALECRMETDDELKERIDKIQREQASRDADKEQKDYGEYLRLKEKFESGNK